MRTLGISIDGVIRDFNSQFHKTYVKTFIHNDSLVAANIPSHAEARMNGLGDGDFVAQETTESDELMVQQAVEKKEKDLISLPVNSDDLLNHYRFEEGKMDFITTADGKEPDKIITPKDALNKFIFEDYPFQIFGMASEYDGANEMVNRIQGYGRQKEFFNVVLLSSAQKQAIPATYNFLARCHSRAKSVVFVEREEDKWDHCDVLIDANPRAIQAVPTDKFVIRILRDWNQYDDIEYTYSNLKEVLSSGVLDKLFK